MEEGLTDFASNDARRRQCDREQENSSSFWFLALLSRASANALGTNTAFVL
mgnify:FL=1